MPALCPLCVLDEYTATDRTADGVAFGSCSNPEHGGEPFVWEVTEHARKGVRARDGIGADLGVWDKLLQCVHEGEPAVAYGTVEDRLFERFPDEAASLLQAYGHRWRDPEHRSGRFSMSAYLATRLSELAEEGLLEKTWGPAEGQWAHNSVISYWRLAGTQPAEVPRAEAAPSVPRTTPRLQDDDVNRLADRARMLPPPENEYTETDYVTNLMATVLDYQMQTPVVEKAIRHYKDRRWDDVRTIGDLERCFTEHPDTEAGNRSLAQFLWGNNHWTRAHQLRDLAAFFRSIGVTDQPALEAWAAAASFDRDFRGRVKGLGPAVFQWLIMRQGVDTVKPDVHVRRFAEGVLGRALNDTELIALVTATAERIGLGARDLDWRIWEWSRGQ